jgi:hypothetical protein
VDNMFSTEAEVLIDRNNLPETIKITHGSPDHDLIEVVCRDHFGDLVLQEVEPLVLRMFEGIRKNNVVPPHPNRFYFRYFQVKKLEDGNCSPCSICKRIAGS